MMIRACFARKSSIRYISHLEIMATLRRAFRRAKIPVAYSQGFNPHQKLALGQPLPVGMTGENEYFDLELIEGVDLTYIEEQINKKLPAGLQIKQIREIPDSVDSLMAVVNTAIYLIQMDFSDELENEGEIVESFLARASIEVLRKRRKKKDRMIDIRSLIYNIEINKPACWRFTVSTGSQGNLRPDEVIRALAEFHPQINVVPVINVHREGMFVRIEGQLYRPIDQQVVRSVDNE